MSLAVKELTDPIYGANYLLLFGTLAQLRAWGSTGKEGSLVRTIADGMADGECRGRYLQVEANSDGCTYHAVFVRSDLGAVGLFTVPAHEAFHAATAVLLDRGLRLSPDSEEAFAYLQTYLLEHFYTLMHTKQKRRLVRRLVKRSKS